MAIFFGGTEILNIPQIKFGNTDVQEVYWGGTKIWPAGPVAPTFIIHYPLSSSDDAPGFTHTNVAARDGVVAGETVIVTVGLVATQPGTPTFLDWTMNGVAPYMVSDIHQDTSARRLIRVGFFTAPATAGSTEVSVTYNQTVNCQAATASRWSPVTTISAQALGTQSQFTINSTAPMASTVAFVGGTYSVISNTTNQVDRYATGGGEIIRLSVGLCLDTSSTSNGPPIQHNCGNGVVPSGSRAVCFY